MTDTTVKKNFEKNSKIQHKYCGVLNESGLRLGHGCEEWFMPNSFQKYAGQYLNNNLHKKGFYVTDKKGSQTYFDGLFYANKLEGYGKVIYSNNTVFEGLFKQHLRFGPGVLSYPNGTSDVGVWDGFFLRRLSVVIEEHIPRLGITFAGVAKLLKYRKFVPVCVRPRDWAENFLAEFNATTEIAPDNLYNVDMKNVESLLFNSKIYHDYFFDDEECTIDLVLSQEEFEKELLTSTIDEVTPENKYNFDLFNTGCMCFRPMFDHFDHLCIQSEEVEVKLQNLKTRKEQIENKLLKCKDCCKNVQMHCKNVRKQQIEKNIVDIPEVIQEKSNIKLEKSEAELKTYLYLIDSSYLLNMGECDDVPTTLSKEASQNTLYSKSSDHETLDIDKTTSEMTNYDICGEEAIQEQDNLFSFADNDNAVCFCNDMGIENVDFLKNLLENLNQEETFYTTVKQNLKHHMDIEFQKLNELTGEETRFIKKIKVTDLLAWNNEEIWIKILQHCFRHRNSEYNVTFNVKELLIGHRHNFQNPGPYEINCRSFLIDCAEGRDEKIVNYISNCNVNPDLCDARGNTGIMFAVAGDRVNVISTLVNCGANLDIINDEGLSPLTMSLLKFISIKFGIINWEKAFLKESDFEDVNSQQWHFKNLLLNVCKKLASDSLIATYLMNDKPSICVRKSQSQEIDALPIINNVPEEKYFFNTEYIHKQTEKPEKEIKTKGKKKKSRSKSATKKREEQPLEIKELDKELVAKQLEPIKTTIQKILYYGVNPNLSSVPINSIFLVIFADDSDLMNGILRNNANPNALIVDEQLTGLLLIASLEPTTEKIKMCKLLLDFNADPNIKTCMGHWAELKNEVIGAIVQKEDISNEPKNILHILSLRDFTSDSDNLLGQMASILIEMGCSTDVLYLGHTALSLAVLRGNIQLIAAYLQTKRVNPYQILGNEMGNAMTILILNRYSGILSDDLKQQIIKTLIDNNMNPLHSIGKFENIISFLEHETSMRSMSSKDMNSSTIQKTDSLKQSSKQKSLSKTLKSPKKWSSKSLKKSRTKSDVNIFHFYVIEETRKILYRHLQAKAVKCLFDFVEQSFIVDPLVIVLAKFIDPEGVLEVINLLFRSGEIKTERYNIASVCDLIKFIEFQHVPNYLYSKQEYKLLKDKIKQMSWNKVDDDVKIYLPVPEVDKDTEKYVVCFQCLKSRGLKLLKCPSCEIVYFCSEECDVLNSNTNSYHKCNVRFYTTVTEITKNSIQPSRLSILLNLMKKMRDERKVLNELLKLDEKITQSKLVTNAMKDKATTLILNLKKMQNDIIEYATSNNLLQYELLFLKVKDSKNVFKNVTDPSNVKCKQFNYPLLNQVVSNFYEVNTNTVKPAKSVNVNNFSINYLDFKVRRCYESDSNPKYVSSGPVIRNVKRTNSRSPRNSRNNQFQFYPNNVFDPKAGPRLFQDSSPIMKLQQEYNKTLGVDFINNSLPSKTSLEDLYKINNKDEVVSDKTTNAGPKKYYMELLSKIFADFNLPLMLLPYACYKDGQIYYSMSGGSSLAGSGFCKFPVNN